MSNLLFYQYPNLFEWETEIVHSEPSGNFWVVQLRDTAFYPEGGGQPPDLGRIDGIEVVDVQKRDGTVFHWLKEKPRKEKVFCKIDQQRRIDHTQHHTGQHLLSAVCLSLFGFETMSFHLGSHYATIDVNTTTINDEQLEQIEEKVNFHIYENRIVRTFYLTREEIRHYPLRKIPEGLDRYRIVEIEGIEYNACAGTHVQQTGEIGMVKILKTEKVRNMTRIYFICGNRARKDYHEKNKLISHLTNQYTTSQDQLVDQIEKFRSQLKTLQQQYSTIFAEYADRLVQDLLVKNQDPFITTIFSNLPIKEISHIAKKLAQQTNQLILLGTTKEWKFILTHNGNLSFHCGKMIQSLAALHEGKGGGNNHTAQAIFQSESNFHHFYDTIIRYLRNETIQ